MQAEVFQAFRMINVPEKEALAAAEALSRRDAEITILKTDLKGDIRDLRAELQDVKTELKGDIRDLRTELKAEIQDLRTEIQEVKAELKGDIRDLRTELKADIAALRTELKAEIQDLRTELKADIQDLRTANLMLKNELVLHRWMLGTVVALQVAVFVHAFLHG
jgi:chromosome segregation ATPase